MIQGIDLASKEVPKMESLTKDIFYKVRGREDEAGVDWEGAKTGRA